MISGFAWICTDDPTTTDKAYFYLAIALFIAIIVGTTYYLKNEKSQKRKNIVGTIFIVIILPASLYWLGLLSLTTC